MKKIFALLICIMVIFCGCSLNEKSDKKQNTAETETNSVKILEKGEAVSLSGMVGYSNRPSDIGEEYCLITIDKKIEYYYKDIYGETSKWSSNVFYTKGEDTAVLKEYTGKNVTVAGTFEAESHGIPYITNITVL